MACSTEGTYSDDTSRIDTVIRDVFNGRLTKQEVTQMYDNWAENGGYDKDLNTVEYMGPEQAAERVAAYFSERQRTDVRVLDVAAGTGKVGQELYNKGFRVIEALDPSEGMLNKARERDVYTNFIQDFIGDEHRISVIDGYYDALVCCGGFGDGHIPVSALHEMIRIVRPGGLICIAMREEYFFNATQYKDSLHPLMMQLETDGKWKQKCNEVVDGYIRNKTGLIFQYVVLV